MSGLMNQYNKNQVDKIHYAYYKFYDLHAIHLILKILNNKEDVMEHLKLHYIPPYKLLLYKDEYKEYGNHRYGWKNAINRFLSENYTEYILQDTIHYERPNFEWIHIAIRYHLNTYEEAKNYVKTNSITDNDIKCIIFDDWIEKTYNWGTENRNPYNRNFITFTHQPVHAFNDFCFSMKFENSDIYTTDNFKKESTNLKILISLSEYHKQQLMTKPELNAKNIIIESLHHPIEPYTNNMFSMDEYRNNENKNIFMLGWWLRKFDNFIHVCVGNHEKKIVVKYANGDYLSDYVIHEIRKGILNSNISTSKIQPPLTEIEIETLNAYKIKMMEHLEDSKYDAIFSKNIIFLDFYAISANNVILECIIHNTPILVKYHPGVVYYLGEDYPFYFQTLSEANSKIEDINIIEKTHDYLKKMDKTPFLHSTFNDKLRKLIQQQSS